MARSPLFRFFRKSVRDYFQQTRESDSPLTRREFAKRAGFVGAAAAVSTFPWESFAAKAGGKGDDVIILGAGFAGLTAAYRLSQARVPYRIFEASQRCGGRVLTKNGFNGDGMFCELGAELVDTVHVELIELCKELGLVVEDLRGGDTGVDAGAYMHGGKIYSDGDLRREVQPLCQAVIRDAKKIFGDGEREGIKYSNMFKAHAFDKMNLEEYLNSIRGLATWVKEMVRLAYVGEFGLEAYQQSALNLILMISEEHGEKFEMFGESDESKRIQGGNSRLADALAAKLGIRNGKESANIRWKHELVAWSKKGSSHVLTFKTPGGTREVKASQILCTIPFSVLRGVEGLRDLGFSPRKMRSIYEFSYGTNSKLMIGFQKRIWRSSGAARPTNGSLSEASFQSLWETSRLQKGESGILTNFTGGRRGLEASEKDVAAVLAVANKFYPGLKGLHDGHSAFLNWTKNPHARGSYGCPGPGHFEAFYGVEGESELGGQVEFAGEHASPDWQGFMNGAIQSAEIAAKRIVASRMPKKKAS